MNIPPSPVTFEKKYWWTGKKIGKGTFCKVYSGTTKDSSKEVAVKKMKKKILTDHDVKSMMDEIAILKELKHPNIIRLYDFFETDQAYLLVMELLTGGDLFDRITYKESYDEREARDATRNVVNAIHFIHSKGIAHRDLKPENLLLVSKHCDTNVKLADFGKTILFWFKNHKLHQSHALSNRGLLLCPNSYLRLCQKM